jgi:hypothetical protein
MLLPLPVRARHAALIFGEEVMWNVWTLFKVWRIPRH